MPERQTLLPLDLGPLTAPVVAQTLRDEIAQVWSLPLGTKVDITFKSGRPCPGVAGTLELAAAPNFPWDKRQPLALRMGALKFSSDKIASWSVL